MDIQLDPREVLAHLKSLGYDNITKNQLKEFIKDLKRLIKHDLKNTIKKTESSHPPPKPISGIYRSVDTQTTPLYNRDQRDLTKNSCFAQEDWAREQAVCFDCVYSKHLCKCALNMSTGSKENASNNRNDNEANDLKLSKPLSPTSNTSTSNAKSSSVSSGINRSQSCRIIKISSKKWSSRVLLKPNLKLLSNNCSYIMLPNKKSKSEQIIKIPKRKKNIYKRSTIQFIPPVSNKATLRWYQVQRRACHTCSSNSKGMEKEDSKKELRLRPCSSVIKPSRSVMSKSSKSDPVSLYHRYQNLWSQHNLPGENPHLDIRWRIRHKMMGQNKIMSEERVTNEHRPEWVSS